ncbi:DUF438 domain-containing protein [Gemmatimonadota bacterium]
MEITPGTKVLELIRVHDFMLDFLADYAAEFEKLKNPILQKTMGRFATLQMAASMAGVPLETLLADIAREITDRTGERVIVEGEAGPLLDPERIDTLKGIIKDLHDGTPVEELKSQFAELLQDVSPTEISRMEQQLIAEGLPTDEVKNLCDVHVQVFRDSLEKQERVETPPGHPIHTFQAENEAFGEIAKGLGEQLDRLGEPPSQEVLDSARDAISGILDVLSQIDIHYLRKENQLFPFLEKHGVAGPSQVMWAIHDDVRSLLKETRAALDAGNAGTLAAAGGKMVQMIVDMIYKEENILFPMSLDTLQPGEWGEIHRGEGEIGFALVTPGTEWSPPDAMLLAGLGEQDAGTPKTLPLDTGLLSLDQVNLMLKNLPVDISFVDENDEVRYYSDVPDRIFPRSPGVIGRTVQNCHPQKSVHMVQQILEAFRAGEKDTAAFWIEMNDLFIHIRYFAMRDPDGTYRGCLEVSQDVAGIRSLEGERRLLDWGEGE